jgi:hypothetical protein
LESTIKSLIEANPDKSLEEILKDNNYMYLINESGKYQIIDKLNTGDSWDVDSGTLLRDGIKYGNIQFDPSKQAFVLTRIDSTLPQNSEIIIPTDEAIFNAFVQGYEGLELDSNLGALDTVKKWIEDAKDDFELFYDPDALLALDSLYNLFTYMLDTD